MREVDGLANSAKGVFISYRRGESGHVAGRLADRLGTRLSRSEIFMDVDRINPGEDFSVAVTKAVNASAVLIVIIGPHWLETLLNRDDRQFDWVRHEISLALNQGVTVIPVLVDGATMPWQADLPTELRGLSTRHAVMISHERFSADIERLVGAIMEAPRRPRTVLPAAAPPAAGTSPSATIRPGGLSRVALPLAFVLGVVSFVAGFNIGGAGGGFVILLGFCLMLGAGPAWLLERQRVRRSKNRR